MKMEENVRRLEGQLKDTFKGQLDSFAVVKDNMEMTDKLREVEKKSAYVVVVFDGQLSTKID